MKKKTFLKSLCFTSLALLMGAAGVFAFAPIGTTTSPIVNANELETTTEQGLITPKADDPVIYTTESGLEIKFGNATVANGGGNETMEYDKLTSGNLNGFPYFTTQKNSTTYTWVLIGRNSNITSNTGFTYDTLANWQNKTGVSPTYKNFFDKTYEIVTPAGVAIKNNNLLNDFTARKYTVSSSLSSLKTNDLEIPAGCVLCLLNSIAETSSFASSRYDSTNYYSNASNNIRSKCEGFYSNDTFGFGTLLSSLQNITVSQGNVYCPSNWSWSQTSVSNQKFFPLNADYSYPGTSNFKYTSYLTSAQFALGTTFWTRGHAGGGSPMHIDESGVETAAHQDSTSSWTTARGIRPACVIKIF